MSADTTMLQQANNQRSHAKRATFDAMAAKKPNRSEFTCTLDEDEGPVSFLFVAIGPTEYDKLVTEHPPTEKQKAADELANVNKDTFPPALLALVCREPELTVEQWTQIWKNEAYSTGERASIYWEANTLCNKPLNLTPFANG